MSARTSLVSLDKYFVVSLHAVYLHYRELSAKFTYLQYRIAYRTVLSSDAYSRIFCLPLSLLYGAVPKVSHLISSSRTLPCLSV